VLKARGSRHSNQYREYRITDDGIQIVELFGGEGGTLTGAARQELEAREELEERRRQQQRVTLETQIMQRRAAREAQLAELEAEIAAAELELENMKLEEDLRQAGREVRLRMRSAKPVDDDPAGSNGGGAQ